MTEFPGQSLDFDTLMLRAIALRDGEFYDHKAALQEFERVLAAARLSGDEAKVAKTHLEWGNTHFDSLDLHSASEQYRRGIDCLSENQDNALLLGKLYGGLGFALYTGHNYGESAQNFNLACQSFVAATEENSQERFANYLRAGAVKSLEGKAVLLGDLSVDNNPLQTKKAMSKARELFCVAYNLCSESHIFDDIWTLSNLAHLTLLDGALGNETTEEYLRKKQQFYRNSGLPAACLNYYETIFVQAERYYKQKPWLTGISFATALRTRQVYKTVKNLPIDPIDF